jgi:hypothetical protein
MSIKRRRVLVVGSILVVCIIAAVCAKWRQNRSDASLIAELLHIEALPSGTRIIEIHKDMLPDTVVWAHLVIPAGTVGKLVAGIPLEERKDWPAETRYGVVMTKRWYRHFSNADFTIECDDTGRQVYVYCAVD